MDGFDIIPDGSPVETPEAGATEAYQGISATAGKALGTQLGWRMRSAMRVGEQGQYQGSGWLSQLLYGATTNAALSDGAIAQDDIPGAGTVPAPMLSPAEYNAKYGPRGTDGKTVSLGTEPLPEPVAKLIAEAKTEEIERENILSRYENAHSWPVNFAMRTLGFMLDPLGAATAFVPGLGEEAILARLGTGLVARTAARLGAGAAGGALAGAGTAGLQYGLGTQEASDYSLREAFRDMAFGAAGFAVGHAFFGGVGDALRWALPRPAEAVAPVPEIEPQRQDASAILGASAETQHAAISTAVGQLAEGRPVEVEPFFYRPPQADTGIGTSVPLEGAPLSPEIALYRAVAQLSREPSTPADVAIQQAQLYRDGFAPGISGDDLRAASASVYEPRPEPETASAPAPAAAGQGEATPPATPVAQNALGAPRPSPAPRALVPIPREPQRLASFLKAKGGVQDQGGEISHILGRRARPGFINQNGLPLNEAALQAWEAGYLPGAERPDTNALIEALGDDLNGRKRYSEGDAQALGEYHDALASNTEIDRLLTETGIDPKGKTRDQVFDEIAGHMSLDRAARESEEIASAHEASLAEAERKAQEWAASRGDAWEPEHDIGTPRTLEELEDAYRQEEAARWSPESVGRAGEPGLAPGGEGPVQIVSGPGERGAGAGRGGPASERTDQGDQLILPGGERSAVQAAASREAAGGMLRSDKAQAGPGELFELAAQAQDRLAQPDLLPAERAEIEAAQAGLTDAEAKSAAIEEAGACLTEGEA